MSQQVEDAGIAHRCATATLRAVVRRSALAVGKNFTDQLHPYDLIPEHYQFLELLYHQDGMAQVDLAEAIGRDEGGVTRTTTRLENRRLVTRRGDEQDRRSRRVFITAAGRAQYEAAHTAATRFDDALTDGLSPVEIAQFRRTTERIVENANRTVSRGASA